MNVAVKDSYDSTTYLMNYFSSWTKLKKAVAWFLKLKLKSILLELGKKHKKETDQSKHVMTTRKGKHEKTGPYTLLVSDMVNAEMGIVQFCQRL